MALSGNGMASLLLGYAGSGSAGFTANPFFQWIYTAPWVQDDIKLTRKLALNFGLRWDITSPVTERYNRMNRDFFADTVNPISSKIDQTKFPGYKVYGGIGFAGAGRTVASAVQQRLEQFPAAHRRRVPAQSEDRAARRLGDLLSRAHRQRTDLRLQPEHAVWSRRRIPAARRSTP